MEIGEAFDKFMRPPYFPVQYTDLVGDIRFHTLGEGKLDLDGATVLVREVPHVGVTLGYRVEVDDMVVTYISDHQMPMDGSMGISDGVRELCDGADVLIHDAQYTPEEFAERAHWGHCTVEYAVHVARECGVRRLVLFHHDPAHCDSFLDDLLADARLEAGPDLEVLSAAEGMTLSFDREARRVRARAEA
jgi:phosphoribosyl 1,2-cyclic phosphodiesterase